MEPLLHAFTLNSLGKNPADIAEMPHRPMTDLRRRKGPQHQPKPHQPPPRRPAVPLRQPKR
ncbi:hypothetical protein [Georgenia subflava]|uniref:Uncharacterized protein n=1 Tax=Georgenia subflava TaxID=1622177 RepID=A0A6N7ERJ7_9MICO|nr:hypothetical protein [Georgenia subflava]MPV38736.1 hypothetical protein [Georgenia subflava]